jgi:hypothetical protein
MRTRSLATGRGPLGHNRVPRRQWAARSRQVAVPTDRPSVVMMAKGGICRPVAPCARRVGHAAASMMVAGPPAAVTASPITDGRCRPRITHSFQCHLLVLPFLPVNPQESEGWLNMIQLSKKASKAKRALQLGGP